MSAEQLIGFNPNDGSEIRGKPPCGPCGGVCCSVDAGFKFVQLTPREQANPLFREVLTEHPEARVMGFFFRKKNGGAGGGYCPFFNITQHQCRIYDDRPQNCRNYDCRCNFRNGEFFRRNPQVLAIIDQQSQSHKSHAN